MTFAEKVLRDNDLVHRASLGSKEALEELKRLHPRKEFRRSFDEMRGTVLKCRGKGTKAAWKRL